MLRHPEAVTTWDLPISTEAEQEIGVSVGTAAVIGLQHLCQADKPTTAYLMIGERCGCDCAFCTQAHSSTARSHFLSRIAWPPYPLQRVLPTVAKGFAQRTIKRCCLQVTVFPGYLRQTLSVIEQLRSLSSIPISASIVVSNLDAVRTLLACGAERVTIALDAACERVYRKTKGSDWQSRLNLLRKAADRFPDRIGTHLIAGLGETEQEMCTILQEMVDCGVTIGLFSFTPVPGTMWANRLPPPLPAYRRIQVARYLLATGASRMEDWSFSPTGQLISYGLHPTRLRELLANGLAFETAGCPDCNRPYYNERPRKTMYNYPRPLNAEEIEAAISIAMAELTWEDLACSKRSFVVTTVSPHGA
nr:radical SAM protein [Chloroflexota bacterium]